MSSLVARRITASYFVSSSPHQQRHLVAPLSPLLLQFLSTRSEKSAEEIEIPFIAHYLISSFGFSRDRAVRYSTLQPLTSLQSSDRPESVIKFLKETGLSDTQIKAVVSFYPFILARKVEKTLKPKVCELMDAGFSRELLVELIRCNPHALVTKETVSRVIFWRDFIGKGEEGLLKVIPRNTLLFTMDIDKHVGPKINMLKEYGFSNRDVVSALLDGSRCMTRGLNSLREKLELVVEMGLPRGSGLCWKALKTVSSMSKETMKRKMQFFKTTCGWSEEEISTAFKRFPCILSMSTTKVKLTMDFLIKEVGVLPKSIVCNPALLGYSLKKRLVPRHHVLSILVAKGLKKRCSLMSASSYPEKIFLEKYVNPYEKDVPELAGVYSRATGENSSV